MRLYAEMAKLVDASASKADVERRVGPSPTFGTKGISPFLLNDKTGGVVALLFT